MNERTFVVIFLLVTVIAVGGLILNKVSTSSTELSPSASPSGLVFNNQSGAPANQNQSQVAPPTQTSNPQQARQWSSPPPPYPVSQLQGKVAVIKTAKGDIAFQLDPTVLETTSNFIFLATNHFYDGLTFHRVEPGFVIQGGDPVGNGSGGPGYSFNDELTGKEKYTIGTVAMANAGPNTNGSQFFIMLADHPELPPNYTVFGHVVQGQDVVSKIAVGDVMQSVQIEQIKQ
jgi:cyclophilin family peptidyl-prolyl cis-trans isomerase